MLYCDYKIAMTAKQLLSVSLGKKLRIQKEYE